ncbi:MAG: signal peptidase I [Alkalispirochaetaceae bacterium]
MSSSHSTWRSGLVSRVEALLTWRKARKARKAEKQRQKNVVVDWIEAFIWAAFVVLLVNQYLLQAYQIPSGSMINTLELQDRIFVNKLVYGPELIPGMFKLPGFETPERGEVIIFENPSYIGRGPLFDVLQRVIYMLTLSLVDIDRDERGRPRAHFLIKRAVGYEGDRIRLRYGEVEIRPAGSDRWYSEEEFKQFTRQEYPVQRLIDRDEYATFSLAGRASALSDAGLGITESEGEAIREVSRMGLIDPFFLERSRTATLYQIDPTEERLRRRVNSLETGYYVPRARLFPLGDNRDNSRDARYFGSVTKRTVLGRAMFVYWPFSRFGAIR